MAKTSSQPAPGDQADLRGEQKAEQRLREMITVESALIDLQTPSRDELRGRPTDAAQARIDEFLKSDQLYRSLEKLYSGEGKGSRLRSWELREAVEERLKIFEKLSHRNPELKVEERVGDNYRHAYRILAAQVVSNFLRAGEDLQGGSIFRLEELSLTRIPTPLRPAQPDISLPLLSEHFSPTSQKEDKTLQAKEEAFDEPLLDAYVDYLTDGLPTIREHANLAHRVEKFCSENPENTLTEIFREHDGGRTSLELCGRIVRLSKELESASPRSVFQEARLHAEVLKLQHVVVSGVEISRDPIRNLVLEGLLTSDTAISINKAGAATQDGHPKALEYAKTLDEKGVVITTSEFIRINHAIIELHQRLGDTISGPLRSLATKSSARIDHLERLAVLSRYDVPVRKLTNVGEASEQFIASVVQDLEDGKFQRPGGLNPLPNELSKFIATSLHTIRHTPEELVTDIAEALSDISYLHDPKALEAIHRSLLTARKAGITQLSEPTINEFARNLVALHAASVDLAEIADILGAPTRDVPQLRIVEFVQELAKIAKLRTPGINRLVKNMHNVWKAEQKGDHTQSIVGFLDEARVSLQLREHGYRITEVSLPGAHRRYEYDAVGYDASGKPCAFEIKHNLGTVSSKERDELNMSQLYHFIKSSKRDGYTPIFAIPSYEDRDYWAVVHLRHLFDLLEEEFGFRPKFIRSDNGSEILV